MLHNHQAQLAAYYKDKCKRLKALDKNGKPIQEDDGDEGGR